MWKLEWQSRSSANPADWSRFQALKACGAIRRAESSEGVVPLFEVAEHSRRPTCAWAGRGFYLRGAERPAALDHRSTACCHFRQKTATCAGSYLFDASRMPDLAPPTGVKLDGFRGGGGGGGLFFSPSVQISNSRAEVCWGELLLILPPVNSLFPWKALISLAAEGSTSTPRLSGGASEHQGDFWTHNAEYKPVIR